MVRLLTFIFSFFIYLISNIVQYIIILEIRVIKLCDDTIYILYI